MRCRLVASVVVGSLLGSSSTGLAQVEAGAVPLTPAEQERFLRTAPIVSRRTMEVGSTAPERATLSDGTTTHLAQIQAVDERESRRIQNTAISPEIDLATPFGFSNSYKHSIAAYRLSRHLAFGMVPVSVERRIDGVACAMTWWVDDVLMDEQGRRQQGEAPPDDERWADQMAAVRVFDQLIGNIARSDEDLLITRNWDLWMIDHTRAFGLRTAIRASPPLDRCPRRLLAAMRALDQPSLDALLGEWLSTAQIEAVLMRATAMVRRFDERVARLGDDAVLFDLPR